FSLTLTGSISFLAILIIPDGKRAVTQVVTNGTATTDNVLGKTWWEVDYLRKGPAPNGQNGDWGYVIQRVTTAGGKVNPLPVSEVSQIRVVDRATQHVERDNGGYR